MSNAEGVLLGPVMAKRLTLLFARCPSVAILFVIRIRRQIGHRSTNARISAGAGSAG